jgi:hypothetical protein
VSKALKATGGASSEYQHVLIELKYLKQVLRRLETLEPTRDNIDHVNAIRGMALACQLPLRDFLTKLEKYESSLGPFASRMPFRTVHNKARWAVSIAEDVEKLRIQIAAKVMSINLLLATHSSHTLSRMDTRTKKDHKSLMVRIAEAQNEIDLVREDLNAVKDQVADFQQATRPQLEVISKSTAAVENSLVSIRSIGSQILSFISTFPVEVRDLFRGIMQENHQLYTLLLQIQQTMSVSPTSKLDSNIKFEDVLGRSCELPFEYFRYWEVCSSGIEAATPILI